MAPRRLGFLGPEGTFSEEALRHSLGLVGASADAELVALPTVHEVVLAVASGVVDRALAPIENSLEGSVNEAVDALVHDAPDVRIVGETVLPVHYVLAAREQTPLESLHVVHSHPQSLAQCARFLREQLPGASVGATTSTAQALRRVAESDDRGEAALGMRFAAELYGLQVLASDVQDHAANATRFVWLSGPDGAPAPAAAGAPWKSSLAFLGEGDGNAGWLVRCLSVFAEREINLTRIESRPAKRRLGHYVFLVDLDGDVDRPGAPADGVRELRAHCEAVRVLGSYPAAIGRGA